MPDLLFKLKLKLMKSMMDKRRRETPFNAAQSDMFELLPGDDPIINNSHFFGGDSIDGDSLKMRVGHRSNGMAEVFVIVILKDGRYLATDKQLYTAEECPLKVESLIPGRNWRVTFDGQLMDMATREYHHCRYTFDYIARLPVFYPAKDGDFTGMAISFASQKWNRKFFNSLTADTGMGANDRMKQYHYEQTGRLEGTMTIDDETLPISLAGIRDRAFGRRDWNYMDCHIWLVAVTERGEVLNFSIVSYPHAKNLFCGYTDIGSDRNTALASYRMVSYDHNNGCGPQEMVVDCTFEDGRTLRVSCSRTHDLVTPFDSGNFYFHEAVGTFDISGIPARGTIEIGFNRDSSRWSRY